MAVILGNKSDLDEKEVNNEDIDQFIFGKNLEYFETSAKSGKNINECFAYIMEKLLKQFKENNIKKKDIKETKFKNAFAFMEEEKEIISHEKKNTCC